MVKSIKKFIYNAVSYVRHPLGVTCLHCGFLALGQQGQVLDAFGRLADLGTGITGIGAQEQIPPGLQALMGILGIFPGGFQSGSQSGTGKSGVFV